MYVSLPQVGAFPSELAKLIYKNSESGLKVGNTEMLNVTTFIIRICFRASLTELRRSKFLKNVLKIILK